LNHIDIEVVDTSHGTWRLTGLYDFLDGKRRRNSWNLLRRHSETAQFSYIIGNFNDILSFDEKKGRVDRPN